MTALKVVKFVSFIVALLLIFMGLAYLWHYIPEGPFFGVEPSEGFTGENAWKEYNELTGWALIFTGFTTLTFVLVLRKFNKSIFRYLLLVCSSLLLSLVLASMVITLVEIIFL